MDKTYLPGLNTLRLYAALCVVIGHALAGHTYQTDPTVKFILNFAVMGGWDAVTLFFVLSGFLITYLLLIERRQTGTISVRRFYARRSLRIFPLYYLIILLSLWIAPEYIPTGTPVFLALIALSPHLAPALGILGHLWSIGVEEWFYLVWSGLVKRFNLLHVIAVILVSRLALGVLFPALLLPASKYGDGGLLFLRQIHYDAMAVGALGAWLVINRHWTLRLIYRFQPLWWGITALTIVLPLDGGLLYDLAIAWVFMALVVSVSTAPKPLIRLEYPLLSKLGQMTYGIYMVHMLAIYVVGKVATTLQVDTWVFVGLVLVSTITIAACSYRWFERPFLALKPYGSRTPNPPDFVISSRRPTAG